MLFKFLYNIESLILQDTSSLKFKGVKNSPLNTKFGLILLLCQKNDVIFLFSSKCHVKFYFSNPAKIDHFLSNLEKFVLQLKDDKILDKIISDLRQLHETWSEEKIKLIDSTLVSILTQYSKLPSEYEYILESTLLSILKEGDISNKHEYYKKYLRILYKVEKLSLLLTEAVKMHEYFTQDIYPLGMIKEK